MLYPLFIFSEWLPFLNFAFLGRQWGFLIASQKVLLPKLAISANGSSRLKGKEICRNQLAKSRGFPHSNHAGVSCKLSHKPINQFCELGILGVDGFEYYGTTDSTGQRWKLGYKPLAAMYFFFKHGFVWKLGAMGTHKSVIPCYTYIISSNQKRQFKIPVLYDVFNLMREPSISVELSIPCLSGSNLIAGG